MKRYISIPFLISILVHPLPPTLSGGESKDGYYRIGEGDILEISVFDEEELNKTVRVSEDGMIIFPLIGKIKVSGLTALEVAEYLRSALARDYIVDPQVMVFIQEYASKDVQVLGSVKEPGTYFLRGRARVVDIISRAGGILPEGGKTLYLIRGIMSDKGGKEKEIVTKKIDLVALLKKGDIELNESLEKGDVVFIPKADDVFIIGEVNEPGDIQYEDGLTLLQGISKAGGFTKSALLSKVQIIRMQGDKEVQIRVNTKKIQRGDDKDPPLNPQDIVIVPESIF